MLSIQSKILLFSKELKIMKTYSNHIIKLFHFSTKSDDIDVMKLLQDIHKELMNLAALFKLELEEHKFEAIQDSLTSEQVQWLCPLGQITEQDICSMSLFIHQFF